MFIQGCFQRRCENTPHNVTELLSCHYFQDRGKCLHFVCYLLLITTFFIFDEAIIVSQLAFLSWSLPRFFWVFFVLNLWMYLYTAAEVIFLKWKLGPVHLLKYSRGSAVSMGWGPNSSVWHIKPTVIFPTYFSSPFLMCTLSSRHSAQCLFYQFHTLWSHMYCYLHDVTSVRNMLSLFPDALWQAFLLLILQ